MIDIKSSELSKSEVHFVKELCLSTDLLNYSTVAGDFPLVHGKSIK